jgi:hypothetical protein
LILWWSEQGAEQVRINSKVILVELNKKQWGQIILAPCSKCVRSSAI